MVISQRNLLIVLIIPHNALHLSTGSFVFACLRAAARVQRVSATVDVIRGSKIKTEAGESTRTNWGDTKNEPRTITGIVHWKDTELGVKTLMATELQKIGAIMGLNDVELRRTHSLTLKPAVISELR